MRNLITGLLVGVILGVFSTSLFAEQFSFRDAIISNFTITSVITGIICASLANYLRWDFGIVLGSVVIGILVFYAKFLITGHHHDPIFMGLFNGLIFGSMFTLFLIIERRLIFKKEAHP